MRSGGLLTSTAALVVLLTACAQQAAPVGLGQPVSDSDVTTTTADVSPSTSTTGATAVTVTAPRPSTAPPPPLPGLGVGAQGSEVAALERGLDSMRYDVGALDGTFDRVTAFAVTAFQKVHGLPRTGRATDDVMAAVARAADSRELPPALVPGGGADRVEIDIIRQVLFLYRGGSLMKILPVSTGSNRRFCSQGYCRTAVTPGGSFQIYRQGRGWEYGPLGGLYKPQYFNGGIAIHGAPSVPASPASHGCVRIPMNAAEWFPSQVTLGTSVFVIGGPEDVPPPAPAPPPAGEEPPQPTPEVTSPSGGLLGGLLNPTTTVPADQTDKDRRKNRDRG